MALFDMDDVSQADCVLMTMALSDEFFKSQVILHLTNRGDPNVGGYLDGGLAMNGRNPTYVRENMDTITGFVTNEDVCLKYRWEIAVTILVYYLRAYDHCDLQYHSLI